MHGMRDSARLRSATTTLALTATTTLALAALASTLTHALFALTIVATLATSASVPASSPATTCACPVHQFLRRRQRHLPRRWAKRQQCRIQVLSWLLPMGH